ncbi:MAG: hypothetical protein R3C99_14955 [Pirellulaceae bacterium]
MLASDWLNPGQLLDVNDDLIVSPIDALIGINSLNLNGSRTLEPQSNRSLRLRTTMSTATANIRRSTCCWSRMC